MREEGTLRDKAQDSQDDQKNDGAYRDRDFLGCAGRGGDQPAQHRSHD
jgi:hypothetical protein